MLKHVSRPWTRCVVIRVICEEYYSTVFGRLKTPNSRRRSLFDQTQNGREGVEEGMTGVRRRDDRRLIKLN